MLHDLQVLFLIVVEALQPRSGSVPCRKQVTALCPGKNPRDRTQVFKAVAVLSFGRTRPNIKLSNLRKRRRFLKVVQEIRITEDQVLIFAQ
ncbi:hypothetical protein D3C73_1422650 [compost metagenome]